ncbi:AAA family ATPase [Ovoidimarina sediminis]|uniref:AAA family ATPase n=1 Tax=Ovoidimarina sediminis TaxID=3079856 RepID=UPI002907CD7A|nr:AAA family ATPase [Rhodophyticola sp. MJ-SS7]MDU8942779.1 AAA family ATPase [Rhodophyticola sp. MJ-SS7]
MGRRIHITGASGTGTSTLARALASRLASQAFDTDDFYWVPSDPPFREKRAVRERLHLMEEVFLGRPDWILSGSCLGWGAPILPRVTHVIFLTLPPGMRLARLRQRERQRLGPRIGPGGDLEGAYRGFLDWAMGYDDPGFSGRSRAAHEAWLDSLSQPVLRLESSAPVDELVSQAMAELDGRRGAA